MGQQDRTPQDVTCSDTPDGMQDWFIGLHTTVRLPADMPETERTRLLGRERVRALLIGSALRSWTR